MGARTGRNHSLTRTLSPLPAPAPFFRPSPAEWIYSGAILMNSDSTAVARLLYSFPLAPGTNEPVGCIMAISPANGQIVDIYCVPRDNSVPEAGANFIATAPLVAMNARGQGLHTAYVGQFDSTIYAFDPTNLAVGPIYTFSPATVVIQATMATDFLTMTAGGTLLFPVWEDDDGEYAVLALPNVNAIPPVPTPTPTPAPANDTSGLSPGGAAAVAISVLLLAGAFVAVPVYKAGSVDAALERYAGVKGGVAGLNLHLPAAISMRLPARWGGYRSVAGGGGGGQAAAPLFSSGSYGSGSYTSSSGGFSSSSGGGGYGSTSGSGGGSKDAHSASIFQAATDL